MLCRGTAFCVQKTKKTAGGAAATGLSFFTCSHVAAPWRWPKLYPLPWLEHVKEENTRVVLQVTEGRTGRVLERFLMKPQVLHHDKLDVCVLELQDPAQALRQMAKHKLQLEPLVLSDKVPLPGQPVVSPGYAVEKSTTAAEEEIDSATQNSFDIDGQEQEEEEDAVLEDAESGQEIFLDLRTDQEPRKLCISMGNVNQYKDMHSRGFTAMDRILGDGVCGAPLLDLRDDGKCVGLVEGIVPPLKENEKGEEGDKAWEVRRAIAGNGAFIYGKELLELLQKDFPK